MKKTSEAGINIWKACKTLKFSYLRPEVLVKRGEFLFLTDITPDIYIFKTEGGSTVMLPVSAKFSGSVCEVF